jgi:two-component system NarL family response regulator
MRVFIVEDEPLVRDNLSILLGGESGIEVTGTAASAEEALTVVPTALPDILLSDLGLPGLSGIELIRRIKESHPELEVLAYTVFEDRETVFAALKAGASGYLLKGATPRQLVEALTNLAEGGAPMSPRIARAVINEFRNEGSAPSNTLTQRERQVLGGIDEGYSYKEIAAELGMSPHTVHGYLKCVYEKLHARGRCDALQKARRKGWL